MCLHHPWPQQPEKTMGTHPAEHDLEPPASEEVSRVLPAPRTEVSVTSRAPASTLGRVRRRRWSLRGPCGRGRRCSARRRGLAAERGLRQAQLRRQR